MKKEDYSYILWTLTEFETDNPKLDIKILRKDDPRSYLDIIVFNASHDKIQAIKYKDYTAFVISEKQYQKLKTT